LCAERHAEDHQCTEQQQLDRSCVHVCLTHISTRRAGFCRTKSDS
jgi:hypothetical protein